MEGSQTEFNAVGLKIILDDGIPAFVEEKQYYTAHLIETKEGLVLKGIILNPRRYIGGSRDCTDPLIAILLQYLHMEELKGQNKLSADLSWRVYDHKAQEAEKERRFTVKTPISEDDVKTTFDNIYRYNLEALFALRQLLAGEPFLGLQEALIKIDVTGCLMQTYPLPPALQIQGQLISVFVKFYKAVPKAKKEVLSCLERILISQESQSSQSLNEETKRDISLALNQLVKDLKKIETLNEEFKDRLSALSETKGQEDPLIILELCTEALFPEATGFLTDDENLLRLLKEFKPSEASKPLPLLGLLLDLEPNTAGYMPDPEISLDQGQPVSVYTIYEELQKPSMICAPRLKSAPVITDKKGEAMRAGQPASSSGAPAQSSQALRIGDPDAEDAFSDCTYVANSSDEERMEEDDLAGYGEVTIEDLARERYAVQHCLN